MSGVGMIVIVLVALYIASIFGCYFIAKYRDADTVYWGMMGALFGPLALPFVFFAKTKNRI